MRPALDNRNKLTIEGALGCWSLGVRGPEIVFLPDLRKVLGVAAPAPGEAQINEAFCVLFPSHEFLVPAAQRVLTVRCGVSGGGRGR